MAIDLYLLTLEPGCRLQADVYPGLHSTVTEIRCVSRQWHRSAAASSAALDRMVGTIGSDLLDRLTATNRLHGNLGLDLSLVLAARIYILEKRLLQWWEP